MAKPDASSMKALALDDSDDDFKYEEVEVLSDGEDAASEDLDATMRTLQAYANKTEAPGGARGAKTGGASSSGPAPGQVTKRPEVMDDFLRNFFVRSNMPKTSQMFETEWYELKSKGLVKNNEQVPDVYLNNAELQDDVASLRRQLQEARTITAKASATWDKFRKERDFHRMHHKRVAQEKNTLIGEIKRLKEHFAKYEPTVLELKKKYEAAMKEKMLAMLERDKLAAKLEALGRSNGSTSSREGGARPTAQQGGGGGANPSTPPAASTLNGSASARMRNATSATAASGEPPSGWATVSVSRRNPYEDLEVPTALVKGYSLQKTFKGHVMSVANAAVHPTKPIIVTASDDKTWKMWHMPEGDLIMSGDGHKDWVSGIDFHPAGMCLATGGGDNTVKLWDFEKQRCNLTLSDHKQAVWSVKFHHLGDVLASCSLDHTVRLWDLATAKCKTVLRGHVDSVTEVCWQPFGSTLCTASSDKTVSIWDARTGLCVQTFYGHPNSCFSATFNMLGTVVASSDADGIAKLWDTRMVAEILTINTGKHTANKCAFDRSGRVLAVACDDYKVKCYDAALGEHLIDHLGHEDAVQAVVFDPNGQYLVSCGSDHTFRLWS